MLHNATQKLILKLAEMTRQQKLVWSETSNGVFRYESEGYQVHITQNPIEILLTDLSGREIERADASELSASETDEGEVFTSVVSALRKEVARQVRGTDAAIASILAGLDLDGDGGVETVEEEDESGEEVSNANITLATATVATAGLAAETLNTEEAKIEIVEDSAEPFDTVTTSEDASEANTAAEEALDDTQDATLDEALDLGEKYISSEERTIIRTLYTANPEAADTESRDDTQEMDTSSAPAAPSIEEPAEPEETAISAGEAISTEDFTAETEAETDIGLETTEETFAADTNAETLETQTMSEAASGSKAPADEAHIQESASDDNTEDPVTSIAPEADALTTTNIELDVTNSTDNLAADETPEAIGPEREDDKGGFGLGLVASVTSTVENSAESLADAVKETEITEHAAVFTEEVTDSVTETIIETPSASFGAIGSFGSADETPQEEVQTAVTEEKTVEETMADIAEAVEENVNASYSTFETTLANNFAVFSDDSNLTGKASADDIAATVSETPVFQTANEAIENQAEARNTAETNTDGTTGHVDDAVGIVDKESSFAEDFAKSAISTTADLTKDITTNIFGDAQPKVTDEIPTEPEEDIVTSISTKKDYDQYNPWS